ncbi:hypothetical protein [Salmonella enterica]|uniref:hypothetical protein n=1 Tax=Salmonella enterica TaxID=28901 RepID=UPI00398C7273
MHQLSFRTGIAFEANQQALADIGKEMLSKGVVHDSYQKALSERESSLHTCLAL